MPSPRLLPLPPPAPVLLNGVHPCLKVHRPSCAKARIYFFCHLSCCRRMGGNSARAREIVERAVRLYPQTLRAMQRHLVNRTNKALMNHYWQLMEVRGCHENVAS